MIGSIIGLMLAGAVSSAVVGKLKEKQLKYKDDMNNFVISAGSDTVFTMTMIGSVFGVFAIFASFASVENGFYAWVPFALFALSCILIGVFARKTITVDNDNILVKSYLPPKKFKCSFKDIAYYDSGIGGGAIAYDNSGKKIFSFDGDMVGAKNMIKRLQTEKIPHGEKNQRVVKTTTIKKRWIITKNSNLVTIIILILFLGLVMGIWGGVEANARGEGFFFTFVIIILLSVALIVLILPFMLIPSFKNIHRIEKGLNINFDDEMERIGATSFDFVNKDWYITDTKRVSLVRRDYIKGIVDSYFDDNMHCTIIKLEAIDGSKIQLATYDPEGFKKWLNEGE